MDGKKIDYFPSSTKELGKCEPVYVSFPGWNGVKDQKEFYDLPIKAQNYVRYIEKNIGDYTDISYLGTGRDRNSIIDRNGTMRRW